MEVLVFAVVGLILGWIFVGCPSVLRLLGFPKRKYTILPKNQYKKLMKKLLVSSMLLFSLCASAQYASAPRIDVVRLDSLQYNLFIVGVPDAIKFEWTVEAPPEWYPQFISAKNDTIYYRFKQAGFVNLYARYRTKEAGWSNELNYNVSIK